MFPGQSILRRLGVRLLRPWAWLSLALLASCGGGDRVSTFAPQRLFVFGDEANVIVGSSGTVTDVDGNVITAQPGAKYMINSLAVDAAGAPTGALSCASNALWTQYVGARYAFGFAECNPYAGSPLGVIYAQVRARVADVAAQVTRANAAQGAFTTKDLVTVMVGQRDILETVYPLAASDADCAFVSGNGGTIGPVAQAARNVGIALGNQVNAIANANGKVLIATLPNQGNTPFAYAQNLLGGFARSVCLTNLTNAFNAGLRSTIINDGRLIGLVQADEQLQLVANNAAVFGYVSVSTAACLSTALPPACSTATLQADATTVNYLWVDDRHFSADAHARIGNLAVTRAVNNPF